MFLLCCRLACPHDPLRGAGGDGCPRLGHAGRLACRRHRPGSGNAVHTVAGASARGTASAAVDDHSPGLVAPRAQLQGPAAAVEGSRSRHLWVFRIPAAAERGYPDVSGDWCARGRGSGPTCGTDPGDCPEIQPCVRTRQRVRGKGLRSAVTAGKEVGEGVFKGPQRMATGG